MADNKEETEGKKGGGLFKLIKAVAFVSVVVVVEMVGASMLIPSPHETEELAKELATAQTGEEEMAEAEEGTSITEAQTRTEEESVEVELGTFPVTRYDPEADTTINIDIELFATVLAEEESEFLDQFESNRARVREQVILTLKSADSNQLTDPGLGLIKRRILEKTNRALGKPLVREVLVTRFNFVER